MLSLGLVLNTLGIGLFCWAIFALVVYALPIFVALSFGMLVFRHGAGLFGALLIGIASGALTLASGQIAVAVSRSLTLRVVIAAAFAVPAAMWCLHCHRLGCLRWLGARTSLAEARFASAARHGCV